MPPAARPQEPREIRQRCRDVSISIMLSEGDAMTTIRQRLHAARPAFLPILLVLVPIVLAACGKAGGGY